LCASSAMAQAPCRYTISDVIQGPSCGIFGTASVAVTGMSDNGLWVCGWWQCPVADFNRGFVYNRTTHTFTSLPLPPNTLSLSPEDINNSGLVVGKIGMTTGDRGFVYNSSTGQYTFLNPFFGATLASATGINNNNVVCGWRSIGSDKNPENPYTAFKWSVQTGFVNLGLIDGNSTKAYAINDAGVVAGTLYVNYREEPFLWDGLRLNRIGSFYAGYNTIPLGLNDRNHVVGAMMMPVDGSPWGQGSSFLWRLGSYSNLGALEPGMNSTAYGINDSGIIVGVSRVSYTNHNRAFVAYGNAMWDLTTATESNDLLYLDTASTVNNAGVIATSGFMINSMLVGIILVPITVVQGDVNHTCTVDIDDLLLVLNDWGKRVSAADVNNDGIVDVSDLLLVLENWS
jgi:uncharacterized membrane protein